MCWAANHIAKLSAGQTVQFRPRGNSMEPKIKSAQLVTVEPIADKNKLRKEDIVLAKVAGQVYLHLIGGLVYGKEGKLERVSIQNNKGHVNGWCDVSKVYGILTTIGD